MKYKIGQKVLYRKPVRHEVGRWGRYGLPSNHISRSWHPATVISKRGNEYLLKYHRHSKWINEMWIKPKPKGGAKRHKKLKRKIQYVQT